MRADVVDDPQRLVDRMQAIFDDESSPLYFRQTTLGMAYLRSGNAIDAIEWLERTFLTLQPLSEMSNRSCLFGNAVRILQHRMTPCAYTDSPRKSMYHQFSAVQFSSVQLARWCSRPVVSQRLCRARCVWRPIFSVDSNLDCNCDTVPVADGCS